MSMIIINCPGHHVQKWQSQIELSLTFGAAITKVWHGRQTTHTVNVSPAILVARRQVLRCHQFGCLVRTCSHSM